MCVHVYIVLNTGKYLHVQNATTSTSTLLRREWQVIDLVFEGWVTYVEERSQNYC